MTPARRAPAGRSATSSSRSTSGSARSWTRYATTSTRTWTAPPGGRETSGTTAAFCSVLTTHHTGEDEGAFPVLAARFPELRPVIAELERDHHIVADGLRNLQRLVDGLEADPGPDPARFRSAIDVLAALLGTHLTYEERKIVPALDPLTPGDHADRRLPERRRGPVSLVHDRQTSLTVGRVARITALLGEPGRLTGLRFVGSRSDPGSRSRTSPPASRSRSPPTSSTAAATPSSSGCSGRTWALRPSGGRPQLGRSAAPLRSARTGPHPSRDGNTPATGAS